MSNKKLVRDVLISIPISILYIFFIQKLIDLFNRDLVYDDKIKRSIAISFVAVIVGFVLAFKIFSYKKTYNRIAKYSLIFGSTFIFLNSILYQWPQLASDTKLIIIGISLVSALVLSYKFT